MIFKINIKILCLSNVDQGQDKISSKLKRKQYVTLINTLITLLLNFKNKMLKIQSNNLLIKIIKKLI